MPTGVELQVQKMLDSVAGWKKALVAAASGKTLLWNLAWAANDQLFCNRMATTGMTAVDTAMINITHTQQIMNIFFQSLLNYYAIDVPSLGGSVPAVLTNVYKWRVHQYASELHKDYAGTGWPIANVCAKEDLLIATMVQSGNVFTHSAGIDPNIAGPTKIAAYAAVVIGAAALTINATLVSADNTTKSVSVSFAAAAPVGHQQIFGEQTLSANAALGQSVLDIAVTAQFTVGQPVLIEDPTTPNQEIGTVTSIAPNVSITLSAPLRWGYTVANGSKVTPLFVDVSACTTTGGTSGDSVNLKPSPDRMPFL